MSQELYMMLNEHTSDREIEHVKEAEIARATTHTLFFPSARSLGVGLILSLFLYNARYMSVRLRTFCACELCTRVQIQTVTQYGSYIVSDCACKTNSAVCDQARPKSLQG